MKKSDIIVKEDHLEDAMLVAKQIPEFIDAYPESKYSKRLKNGKNLILTAYINNEPVGFKIGYETSSKLNFYSWMGGVLPKYRQLGIAANLLEHQENWARQAGYRQILVKTRRKYSAMVKFLYKHDYFQLGIIPMLPNEETRILFNKKI